MKVIHGSLKGLLQEVKDRKVDAVRVAAFMQSDVVANGWPRSTRRRSRATSSCASARRPRTGRSTASSRP